MSHAISLFAPLGALQHVGSVLKKLLEWVVFVMDLYGTVTELLAPLWGWLNLPWPLN
jgi:hypothetical protein